MGEDELALYPEVCTVVRTYAGLSEGGSAWYVMREGDDDWVKKCMEFIV